MNKQRKVLITITYNEMGIIIDTKAEEVAQPNLQPTCNQLATDCISRQAAIEALDEEPEVWTGKDEYAQGLNNQWHYDVNALKALPSAERRGRWENVEHAPDKLLYATCSVCGKRQTVEATNYCGNCGARMVEE